MPFTVSYSKQKDYIVIVVEGELDLTLLQNMAAEVSKIIKRKGCNRILNDLRNAKPAKRIIDIYNMPKTAKRAGVTQDCKRALVVGNRGSDFQFLETVFVNQGHQVRKFEDIEAAEEWLFE
jgi:hypothetical protein